jgi:uncharacterized membrane protein YedE/YeeE
MRIATSVLAGLTFGLGLVISGLVNPAKVLNFLDLLGSWDPSLAFVMAAAVGVTFVGYKLAFRRPSPLLVDQFRLPVAKQIDRRLVIGPAIFGIGWGLSGFCPGPAITSLPLLAKGTLVFVPGMLAGMALTRLAVQPGMKAKSMMPPAGAGEPR